MDYGHMCSRARDIFSNGGFFRGAINEAVVTEAGGVSTTENLNNNERGDISPARP